MKSFLLFCFLIFTSLQVSSQSEITMENDAGVYKIPCKINGLRLKFIFDTGATNVCISENIALMMLDNGYLDTSDIIGSSQSQVADGRIVNNTRIRLKTIEIGDKTLRNIEAVVIHNQTAPLLLGQSAINKLGKYTISGNKLIFGHSDSAAINPDEGSLLSDEQAQDILHEAYEAYHNNAYTVAIDKFNILYQDYGLSSYSLMRLADCYYFSGDYESANDIYLAIEDNIAAEYPSFVEDVLFQIGRCYWLEEDPDNAIKYLNRAIYVAEPWSTIHIDGTSIISSIYNDALNNTYKACLIMDNLIQQYVKFMEINLTDCWQKCYQDQTLATLLHRRCIVSDESDYLKYKIIAAAWGSSSDIEYCKEYSINFSKQPSKYVYK
jgi:clan AA aspartic protease (TIGR02281 family)